jgi:uncharacterized protein (TIGR03790 family)
MGRSFRLLVRSLFPLPGRGVAVAVIVGFFASAAALFAGGSGLNVAVVVNAASTNSLQLANYYCEKRQVPPQNVLRVNWTGGNVDWALGDFQNILLNPLLAMLADRRLTNQIDYVVLSMDIPYRVNGGVDGVNSTTSSLFYGFNSDSRDPSACPLAANSESAYAGSEGIFRLTPPVNAASNSFLVTMITSGNLALARQIVDSGVLSDGTFPAQTAVLARTTDTARSVRYVLFDNAIFNARVLGYYALQRMNSDVATGLGSILGLEFGQPAFSLAGTTFAPGAMADNLTSFGGMIFENTGQTVLLAPLSAGAAGSYGTIVEPCNFLEKFPSPQNHFYQARGFSLAECYYQSVTNPYEGLIVGEPLAAPFALPCSGAWSSLPPSSSLAGTTNLSLQFAAADATRPVQQVDLFVDGTFLQTLTSIAPGESNILHVTINGFQTSYAVPADATIASVASGLTGVLNGPAYRNATKVRPFAHGDRIELQSTDANTRGSEVSITMSNDVGSASALTTFVHASRSNFLDTIAWGVRSFTIGVGVVTNDVLTLTVTKTNGASVSVGITNYAEGVTLYQFIQQFMNDINATASLQGDDGLVAEDLTVSSTNTVDFNLRARSQGFDAAQIQVSITGSFDITPPNTHNLDGNLSDLRPRNHLYITAGVTNLALTFPLDTTTIPDGWHELTAVAYEGSHVRTQKRVSQSVLVQNTTLAAAFDCLLCDTNCGLESTMQFSIVANTNTITRIELFSTGGSWGVATNQPSAVFSVAATNLHTGLHPFYALVTRDDGQQYRTQTKWIRIKPSFALSIAGSESTLSWQAETGVLYEVLSATNVSDTFQLRGSLTATNSTAQWLETNGDAPLRFYRVRTQQ